MDTYWYSYENAVALLAKLDLGLQQLNGLVHVTGQRGAVHGKDVDIAGVERTLDDGVAAKGPKLGLAAKAVVLDHLLDEALRAPWLTPMTLPSRSSIEVKPERFLTMSPT